MELNDEENMLVATVRAFVDRDVKPTVREEYGGTPVSTRCYVFVTQELARGGI